MSSLLRTLALGALAAVSIAAILTNSTGNHYSPRKQQHLLRERTIFEAANYYYKLRRNQITGLVPEEAMAAARLEAIQAGTRKSGSLGLTWSEMGPDNVGGRTRAILIDYFHDPSGNTIFAGGVDGGLWKSVNQGATWSLISDQWENIAVASITQAADGAIYVGTGEYLLAVRGTPGTGNSSCIGGGIWKSSDGNSFNQLASTDPTPNNSNGNNNNTYQGDWSYVFSLNAQPAGSPFAGRIYAGTRRGLRISDDGGQTWINPIKSASGQPVLSPCNDIAISADGKKVIASISFQMWVSNNYGGDLSFKNRSVNSVGLPPSGLPSILSNLKICIAPSDSSVVYAIGSQSSNFSLAGVWKSTDGASTFTSIAPGGSSSFQPLAQQGDYNCCIAVHPTDKNRIFIGGLDLYKYTSTTGWGQISAWNYSSFSPLYVHADNHIIVINKNNPDVMYVGNDGGVFRSINGGQSWSERNRGYNVTQFYSLGFSPFGAVIGGSQDNGTNLINFQGNTPLAASSVIGGDGFDCEISTINPDAYFGSLYFGELLRSANQGNQMAGFFTGQANSFVGQSSFHTIARLWESFNNPNSLDSVNYLVPAGETVSPGETITVFSNTSQYPFTWNNNTGQTFNANDVIKIKDPVQSRMAVGLIGTAGIRVFLTNRPLDFSKDPYWMAVGSNDAWIDSINGDKLSGEVTALSFSGDGDHLFVGTESGNVYRISGLNTIKFNQLSDTITGWVGRPGCALTQTRIGFFSQRVVTSIACDPNDADRILVTLGNYDNTNYVYFCGNAATAPSAANSTNFTSKQGNLPKMPVYSSIIDYSNGSRFMLGTEYGIWTSSNAGSAWSSDNSGMSNSQVFMLRQQTQPYNKCWNSGHVYAATHGRGIFKTTTLTGIGKPSASDKISQSNQLEIFPNPLSQQSILGFFQETPGNSLLRIFDLQGKLVRETPLNNLLEGHQRITLLRENLVQGSYLISVQTPVSRKTTKLVVTH